MNNLFRTIATAISGPPRTRKVHQTTRRVHLDLEVLGGRTLLSVSPILSIAVHTPIAHFHPIQLPHRVDVPNLQGYTFHLNSSNGKPAHTLNIKTETYNRFGSASFTGTWQGDGPNSKPVSGTLVFAPHSHTPNNLLRRGIARLGGLRELLRNHDAAKNAAGCRNGEMGGPPQEALHIAAEDRGRGGHQAGQMLRPHGMSIDSQGNLYVGEASYGRRVQKFVVQK